MKRKLRGNIALIVCAAQMTVAALTARPAAARDGIDNDPQQVQQQQQEPQEQQEVRLTAILSGVAPFNAAFGFAEFESEGARNRLKLEVEHVNIPDGTMLNVLVNGNPLAGVTLLLSGGQARLELDSSQGQTVPMIGTGSTLAVTTTGGATIIHGMFF